MEQRITINGKTWIVPAGQIPSLVGWLNSNAVDASVQQVTEINTNNGSDPDQLICG